MNFEYYGGRKFLLCVACLVIASVLVWFAKITSMEFVTLIGFTVGAYITGNTVTTVQSIKKDQ